MPGDMQALTRRTLLGTASLAASALRRPALAEATPWPTRQIRIVIPFAAGAAQDVFTRLIAKGLNQALKVTVIVDNRPGAGGYLGAQEVVRGAADGSVLLSASNSVSIIPELQPQLAFDPKRDLAPVALICDVAGALMVRQESPLRSLDDLIATAKANPGKLTYGSGGVGSANHLAGALLASLAQIDVVHVPFRGISQATTAVYAGDVDYAFGSMLEMLSQAKDGRARLLGVTTAARLPGLNDVPAIGEIVRGYASPNWFGLFGPVKLPPVLVQRLNDELSRLQEDAELKAVLATGLAIMRLDGPAPLRERLAADMAKWDDLIKRANIRAE